MKHIITSRPAPEVELDPTEEPIFHLRSYGDVTLAQLLALTKPVEPTLDKPALEQQLSNALAKADEFRAKFHAVCDENLKLHTAYNEAQRDYLLLKQQLDLLKASFNAVCAENMKLCAAHNEVQAKELRLEELRWIKDQLPPERTWWSEWVDEAARLVNSYGCAEWAAGFADSFNQLRSERQAEAEKYRNALGHHLAAARTAAWNMRASENGTA